MQYMYIQILQQELQYSTSVTWNYMHVLQEL